MKGLLLGEYAYARQSARKQGLVATTMVVTMKSFIEALAEDGALPPAAFSKRVDEEWARHPINPWIKVLVPSLKRSRETVALFEAKAAMLDIAIDVVLHGEAAAKASVDPFGDGPFTFKKRPNGFELESALKHGDKPVNLVAGS